MERKVDKLEAGKGRRVLVLSKKRRHSFASRFDRELWKLECDWLITINQAEKREGARSVVGKWFLSVHEVLDFWIADGRLRG